MGSGSSRIGSPSPSSSAKLKRRKPCIFPSLVCGCCSSHASLEIEDYSEECWVNSLELRGDPLFSVVQKHKEELNLISTIDTGGLVSSADEAANLSVSIETEGQGNLEQVDAGDCGVSNNGNHLCDSGQFVPPPLVSVSTPNSLDRDNRGTMSSTFSEPQSSEMVSIHTSSNGIVVNSINDAMINGITKIHPEHQGLHSEIEIVENQWTESRAVVCSISGASESPIPDSPAGDETSIESITFTPEFPVFDREHDLEPESVTEAEVSVSSHPLSSSAVGSTGQEARRNGIRSLWDVFSEHRSRVHSDTATPAIVFSTTNDSDYQGYQERWLFNHTDLSDDGIRIDSRYRQSRIQRSNELRRSRRFEFWDRLQRGLYENTLCPLGLHLDGNECSCDQHLCEESSASSSISRIVMLTEALLEVLDEMHRQPMPFSLSMSPVTAPESIVESFPLKSYDKHNQAENEDVAEQCNICFAEYMEGDKIRVLPCHHEYHMECVDKWLKEIHGVCPLCRGDVRRGSAESSSSSS